MEGDRAQKLTSPRPGHRVSEHLWMCCLDERGTATLIDRLVRARRADGKVWAFDWGLAAASAALVTYMLSLWSGIALDTA